MRFLYLIDYSNIFIYLLICIGLGALIIILARLLSPRILGVEKLSAYECGFEPFVSARLKFDVSFALIAILFLVFDLELIFIIPWVINIICLGFWGYVMIYSFLFILVLGFIFELNRNVLNWDNIFM